MVTALIWSIALTAVGDSYLALPEPRPFGQAPDLPTLVDGLPESRFDDKEVCYPWKRFDALSQWIDYVNLYPRRICQPTIDRAVVRCRMRADNEKARLLAEHRAEVAELEIQQAGQWNPWIVGAVAVGLTVLGGFGGYLIGHYAGR